jgi:hypothetical protein
MSTPNSELDKHLQALFGGLDTGADFDARLMARLRAESHTAASERAMRTREREQERARYRRAVSELQGWRRSMLRMLTLDTLGIALLLVAAILTAWPHVSQGVMEISRQYAPYIAMSLGILIAAVPVLAIWAEQTRRSVRLL